MITGTCHFVNIQAAYRYYGYGFSKSKVDEKLKNGEIAIGRPKVKPGEFTFIDNREQRFFIQSED